MFVIIGFGVFVVIFFVLVSVLNIVWYYGDKLFVVQLCVFDVVVVEFDYGFDLLQFKIFKMQWYVYVSVGEVMFECSWYKELFKVWLLGCNVVWVLCVVDQVQFEWLVFYVEYVIKLLWDKGYCGFFFDMFDFYQLVVKDDVLCVVQEVGMVWVICVIKVCYLDVKLIFNCGFEILLQVYDLVYVVVFELLY